MSSKKTKPTLEFLPSYLAAIKNSVGSNLFRNLYYRIDHKTIDVLGDGDLSCAAFVSTILFIFGLIKKRHTTVKSTVKDMQKAGWYEIKKPKCGAVILWGFKKKDDGSQGKHRHVGFFINAKTAISNNSDTRIVAQHHPTFGIFPNKEPRRDILAYYWHNKLS